MALSLSIFLLSASILSFEIIVIRLLDISHWQPFVTLAISTALLGYGLSGSILSRLKDRVFPQRHIFFPVLALAAAALFRPAIHLSGRLHLDACGQFRSTRLLQSRRNATPVRRSIHAS